MTDRKNKCHKQVWPLFVKYVQNRQLIQLLRFASFQTYTLPYAYAASTLMPIKVLTGRLSLSHILSLSNRLPNLEKPPRASLSLCANNPLPCSNNLASHLINTSPMASTGKRSFTTIISTQGSKRARRLLLPAVLPGATMANRSQNSGKGFESLPPLPITSVPFRFLKSLDLNSLGMGLNAVPSSFGWELVE